MNKIVHFTGHAKRRMRIRGFSVTDVRVILAFGQHRATWSGPGRGRRMMAAARLGESVAEVVYTEDDRRILVITVLWSGATQEGGDADRLRP